MAEIYENTLSTNSIVISCLISSGTVFNIKSIIEIFFDNWLVFCCIEKTVIALAICAITVFSMQQNTNQLPKNISMVDFILKTVPEDIKQDITIELVDSVFSYISATRFDT